ncbi:MAG TPA: DNA/RNA non-specific endonuclease [Myxococcales bacterium]|nr:DNA/RNA non-specific endonuclease [Myxococcales bacterium]
MPNVTDPGGATVRGPQPSTQAGAVAPAGGGNTAETQQVPIKDLELKFGWKAGSWQDQLLQDADGSGDKNGSVSSSELDRYMQNPEDLKFVNSERLQDFRRDLGTGTDPKTVDTFKPGWEQNLARAADQLGNKDGNLSAAEFNTFAAQMKQRTDSGAAGPTWFPDQKQAAFSSRLAGMTGEQDMLAPDGTVRDGKDLYKEYMRIGTSDQHRIPQWVAYQLDAADIKETPANVNRNGDKQSPIPAYRRANPFHADPEDGPNAVNASAYDKSGFDQGHMKPAESSPSQEAMHESFLMTNMATQYGHMNRGDWRYLEEGVHELVQATGAKATIITGNAFLDDKGNPLPEDKIQYYEKNGNRMAVPTHCFKTVLLELPDGQMQMMAYLVPNDPKAPLGKDAAVQAIQASRVSVDDIERIIGHDLYSQLPQATQQKLESDPAARISFANASQWHTASLLWPQDEVVK